ncbi:MmgE/PrpD family protein [Nocardia mikamii]|uniref:MmgE/PrpD family protein n=1 Tax=Nocardia mikamii TaxID=508464 RepID=UPI0007A5540D|nr:MmgE/PrpD family protein [Nocardia mikamii]
MTSTDSLAAFVANTAPADIPAEVVDHAKLCLLDTLGCGLYGSTTPQASIVRDMLAESGAGKALVLGSDVGLGPADAALANGTAVHAFELDDLHPRSIVHPGSVVATAALAAAALREETTGREFLTAMVLGYEVAARVGSTMGAAHLLAGWHPTGTHGTLGAAAAAGSVLGLDTDQLADALGAAGSQSAGLMAAQYESMVKRFHAGRAAQSGLYAALLGQRGYTGIRDLFGAEYGGYLSTFSPRADPTLLTSGLGDRWETLAVGFKPYSTNGSCHPSIDCLREMYHQRGVHADDVESVTISVSTATVKHVGWPYHPDTVTTAQMNLPYITAVVLTDGEAFVDQFTPERIADPTLVALTRRVQVVADPEIDALGDTARHKTRLRVVLRDGTMLDAARDHAHGSSKDPMTVDEVRAKFRLLAGTVYPPHHVAALEQAVDTLDAASRLTDLLELLGGRHE